MGSLPALLLLVQVAATLFMTGLIWFVQVVHYPLFLHVGMAEFLEYERLHARRTGWVVGAPMVVELVTACAALWPGLRPAGMSQAVAWSSVGLVGVIWGSTAILQVPLHGELERAPTPMMMGRLVGTNWIRTVAWTGRAGLLVGVLWRLLRVAG